MRSNVNAPKVDQFEGEPPVEPQPKTLAIVQITRIGDLLQTYIAAKSLRTQRPDLRLVLIARKSFAAPLKFLLSEVFDEIFMLDYERLIENAHSLSDIQDNLKEFTGKINNLEIDVLINLSFSTTAEYFTSLIQSKFLLGPVRANNGLLSISDKWSKFVFSNVMRGDLNPFALVDIFKFILGVELKQPEPIVKKENTLKNMVIHPFASQDRKYWKSVKWVELIYKTLKEKPETIISIVGSKEEREIAEEIANNPILSKFRKSIRNLAGLTSIEELFNHLKRADLFVGHDSMVGHLAAIAELPTITISLGSVRPNETTP